MDFKRKLDEIIEKRKAIDYDIDYEDSDVMQSLINLLSNNIDETIEFLNDKCTSDELIWISEVIEDVAIKTKSFDFLNCLKLLSKKYGETSKLYNIDSFINTAEVLLKDYCAKK